MQTFLFGSKHVFQPGVATAGLVLQAVGPVALVSLLLSEGLTKAIPGAEVNANPNQPADAQIQQNYNHAAIQVCV